MKRLTYQSILLSTVISMGHIAYGAGIELSNNNDFSGDFDYIQSENSLQSITQETVGGSVATAHESRRPQDHYCPITRDIMKDPVVASDGVSYERDAITRWMVSNRTSPITRQHLGADLYSNQTLRTLINDQTSKLVESSPQTYAMSGVRTTTENWVSDTNFHKDTEAAWLGTSLFLSRDIKDPR